MLGFHSEWLFKNVSDLLVSEGYADLGYEYVIIDDCWLDDSRDKHNRLQPAPTRFPSGIKALADYVSICPFITACIKFYFKKV